LWVGVVTGFIFGNLGHFAWTFEDTWINYSEKNPRIKLSNQLIISITKQNANHTLLFPTNILIQSSYLPYFLLTLTKINKNCRCSKIAQMSKLDWYRWQFDRESKRVPKSKSKIKKEAKRKKVHQSSFTRIF
jgi:hypothetical protein